MENENEIENEMGTDETQTTALAETHSVLNPSRLCGFMGGRAHTCMHPSTHALAAGVSGHVSIQMHVDICCSSEFDEKRICLA